jgi:hypothetical protein
VTVGRVMAISLVGLTVMPAPICPVLGRLRWV